ncbi:MYC binding protein 2 [Phyllostomus discolor]|uniref:MYC binding protein 2 n=1 Tax=Phyllostomus discolor TaxID=89673 RepID=A0A834DLG2_9CHIR|nr:MYC binding protein 2 [Phyllostomus discolor]
MPPPPPPPRGLAGTDSSPPPLSLPSQRRGRCSCRFPRGPWLLRGWGWGCPPRTPGVTTSCCCQAGPWPTATGGFTQLRSVTGTRGAAALDTRPPGIRKF